MPLLGGRVEQWYALDQAVPVTGTWGSGTDEIWAEQMSTSAPDAEVLMRYGKSNGWLDGQPAAVTRKVGKGRITYIGAMLDAKTMAAAAKWMMSTSGVEAVMPGVPESVEVSVRSGGGKRVVILENLSQQTQTVTLPGTMEDVLTGVKASTLTMAAYGVAVLR